MSVVKYYAVRTIPRTGFRTISNDFPEDSDESPDGTDDKMTVTYLITY